MSNARFAHLTDAEYRAMQCQQVAAGYYERAQRHVYTGWFADAAECRRWGAEYSERARRLMGMPE